MYIYDTNDFPSVEFGDDIKRQIRLIFSPDIGNCDTINIVMASIPSGGVSEGHGTSRLRRNHPLQHRR